MGPASWVKLGHRQAALAAALIAAVCYLNTINNEFVFDDIDIITRNPFVTRERGFLEIFSSHYWAHLTPAGDLYRPLTILTYVLNHRLGGLDPSGYHLANILLHALCSGLVVALAARLGMAPPPALAAGALFASHPIHTEAVAGAVGRAELMAAACVLAAWILHLSRRGPGPLAAMAIGALLAAGLLSKENAVVLPGLLLAGDLRRVRRGEITWRRAAPTHAACAGVVVAWLILRAILLSPIPPGSSYEGPLAQVPAPDRICTGLAVLGRYLWLLVRPLDLSADYSFDQVPVITDPFDPAVIASAAILVLMAVLGGLRLLSASSALDGLCAIAFLVAAAPVSNILVPIGTIMAERLLYIPSVAFCLLLPALWGLARGAAPAALRSAVPGAALASALVALYGARAIARNADWKDQLTLFSVTAVTSPRSAKVRYNLGVALEDSGRPEEALRQYLAALSIKPEDAKSHHNAGLILARTGQRAQALFHLEQASRIDPTLPRVFASLGVVYHGLSRQREAEAAFRRALERDPGDHMALYNLGTLMLLGGRGGEAVTWLERAREAAPADPDGRYQLGLAYLEVRRAREALEELREALSLSPAMAEAHVQMARAFTRLRMPEQAAASAARARASGLELPPDLEALLPREGGP